jgi:hypothetical protein
VDLVVQESKGDISMDRIKRHKEICETLNKIYEQKNHDYGNSFGETYEKLGIISAVTRLSDKYNRICSLATKSEQERRVKDESIKDTLIDLANYSIMTLIEMEVKQNKKTQLCNENCRGEVE